MTFEIVLTRDPADRQRAYQPFGGAREAMLCRDPEVVLEGPAGTGKSRGTLEKLYLCALKYPGMRGLIARKTRASMTESTLVTWENHVVPAGHPVLDGPQRDYRRSYHFPNGSEIVVAGLDKPTRIMSSEYDIAIVPEATELFESDWEMLTTRLRNGVMPYQQMLADINPEAPTHWIHQRTDEGRATVFFSRHEDNPVLYDAESGEWTVRGQQYLSVLDRLSGVRFERLRHGRRAGVEGAVYPFDRAVHLVDRFDIPDDWTRYRVIDFGYTNPFVCQWWAIDGDGRLFMYREIYHTRRTVSVHAKRINKHSEGEHYLATVADHDAEDRATLEEHGIYTLAADKAVTTGIMAVQDRMQVAGDGRARIFIMRDSLVEADPELLAAKLPTCTEQEFDLYVYPKSKDGRPIKEVPVKLHDHGMDALRYLVMYANRGRPTVRSLF